MEAAEGAGIGASVREGYTGHTIPGHLQLTVKENETGIGDMGI